MALPRRSRERIETALARVCGSPALVRSTSLTRLLTYIVRETLEGRDADLKGYSIGVAVFGRPEDFDPESDSIVRVHAQRLRQALKLYYLEDGKSDALRIDVPKGRYVPKFVERAEARPEKNDQAESRIALTVMPIENLSGDPAQDFFALGLMQELVGILGSYRELDIISSHGIGNLPDTKSPETPVCARFLLHGSVRLNTHDIRVNVALVDTGSGRQVWTNRYKRVRTADDLFAIQEQIADDVVLKIADRHAGAINRTLIGDMRRQIKVDPSTYEAVLKLHDYNTIASADTYRSALQALEAAVKAHPEHAMAWAALSELRVDGYATWGACDDKEQVLTQALRYADRAIKLDPANEYVYFARGLAYAVARNTRDLLRTADRLLSLEPPPGSVALGAWFLALAGEWDRGLGILKERPAVLREGPGWLQHVIFLDCFRHARYEEALDAAESFAMPGLFWDPVDRAAALGMLGRVAEGRKVMAEIQALQPDLLRRPRRYLECFILQDDLLERAIEGLSSARMDCR